MRDPRIERLLLRTDETTSRGTPTRVADLAGKVKSLLVEIEKLRSEIEIASRQVMALSAREAVLKGAIAAGNGSAVTAVSGSNALALGRQSDLALSDEPDLAFQRERLETVSANLKARRQFVQRAQDLLAVRINTVQKTLELFEKLENTPSTRTRRRVRRVRRARRRT